MTGEFYRCPHCGLSVFFDEDKKELVDPNERGDMI